MHSDLAGSTPVWYSIVRATQFFEFVGGIAQFATEGATVRLPSALVQPIVSDDVAAALADVAIAEPLKDAVELAGPELVRMDGLVRRFLGANGDPRKVITDTTRSTYLIGSRDASEFLCRQIALLQAAGLRVFGEVLRWGAEWR
jgi:uncharacterized protein YbjT (DUF2867 family)